MKTLKPSEKVMLGALVLAAVLGLVSWAGPPIYCTVWGATDLRCVGSLR